jgi:hypothetical protein
MNESKCQSLIQEFHYLARVVYRVHVLNKYAVFRALIYEHVQFVERTFGDCFDYRYVAFKDLRHFITIRDSFFHFILSAIRQWAAGKYTNILIFSQVLFKPIFGTDKMYVEFYHFQWVMLTGFVTHRMNIKRQNTYSLRWIKLRCKLFLIIRMSLLLKVLSPTIFFAVRF